MKVGRGAGTKRKSHEKPDRREDVLDAPRRRKPWQHETTPLRRKGSPLTLSIALALSLQMRDGARLQPRRVKKWARHCLLTHHSPRTTWGTAWAPGLRLKLVIGLRTPLTLPPPHNELGKEMKRRAHALRAATARLLGRRCAEMMERLGRGAGWNQAPR